MQKQFECFTRFGHPPPPPIPIPLLSSSMAAHLSSTEDHCWSVVRPGNLRGGGGGLGGRPGTGQGEMVEERPPQCAKERKFLWGKLNPVCTSVSQKHMLLVCKECRAVGWYFGRQNQGMH